ncbi:MAG: hypothetical protein FJ386_10650 [Verrucomicrobia bacterium]|nr:hypothetical protein [Verrucomicrobiota bacterium]
MKTPAFTFHRTLHATIAPVCALALLASAPVPDSLADEKRSLAAYVRPAAPAQSKAVTADAAKPGPQAGSKPAQSRHVTDMVKLAEAKVSKDVMLSFLETSPTPVQPGADDVILMKSRGVPDEVVTAMLARGAKVRAEAAQARREVAGPAIVRDLSTRGNLDPESYDFFFYHYLYPRALTYSYKSLAPYSPAFRIPCRDGFTSRRGNSWAR